MEYWKNGIMEGWKDGRKAGMLEEWKDGFKIGASNLLYPLINV